ncbi:HNH endonuclease [Bacillus phage CAM003]|uniref:Uncharacterized protein n=2 Tax=Bastillevirus CAM003 TaxID=1918012 RepID=A0A024AZP0_9CAUD|nr:HNH endonuclease [Bacillus phage CAM003]AHZ09635.1 hypothetical protein [Bacillus phage CAM003]ASU01052.1 hypothetical protein ANTHONY_212 [Bacillus phage Anthony]
MGKPVSDKNRIGKKSVTSEGYSVTCVAYRKYRDVDVQFDDGTVVSTTWANFERGFIKNPNHRSLRGIGFLGVGAYTIKDSDGNKSKAYNSWAAMIERCFTEPLTTVCEEWTNYQVFAEWFYNNYYECGNEVMQLDKDILVKGNTHYSPDTCCIVPSSINYMFTRNKYKRGAYPIGVCKVTNSKRFVATISINNANKSLGRFDTIKEAFEAYKVAKEFEVRRVAAEYKNILPKNVYEAMMSYEVEEDD